MFDKILDYCGSNLAGVCAGGLIGLQTVLVYFLSGNPLLILTIGVTSILLAIVCYIGSLHQEHELEKIRAMSEDKFED